MPETRILNRGFQPLCSWTSSYHIKGVYQRATEGVTAFYQSYFKAGLQTMMGVYSYNSHEIPVKYSVSCDVIGLVYSRKTRLYVAACQDFSLRVFTANFKLISTMKIDSTILSVAFNDALCELYTGGIGEVLSWTLRPKLHNPLSNFTVMRCSLQQEEWANHLHYEPQSNLLVVASDHVIYLVDVGSGREVGRYDKTVNTSTVSFALHCAQLNYLIVGSLKGTIVVWNCELDFHVNTLRGHMKSITGLAHSGLSLMSCSLDKSVKMWNLDSMTECYSVHCEAGVLGLCWEFPKLTCYGSYFVKIWHVSQFEQHFASLNANVIKLTRVESSPLAKPDLRVAKILAQTEDGGVRMLSPITGEVMTSLFPMFFSQLLEDVLYSYADHLLFVLLKTNYVLVCDTHHNPCLTKEIWVHTDRSHKINTLAMCNIVLSGGSVHSLLFGGRFDGDIVLMHSTHSRFSMPHPCPAHDSRVTMLVGATELLPCTPSSREGTKVVSRSALLSYGRVSNRLHVWGVQMREGEGMVTLQLLMMIKMTSRPRHLCLTCGTACASLESNQLVVIPVQPTPHTWPPMEMLPLGSVMVQEHIKEEDHTQEVTSLSGCPYLGLFASSSRDGTVKVWGTRGELLAEINFGGTVTAVGFANPQGDLLVGMQLQIMVIRAAEYLPDEYQEASSNCPYWDHRERPVGFDPHLEFWYDADRVPAFPLCQEDRARYLLRHPEADLTGCPSYALKERCLCLPSPSNSQLPLTLSRSTDSSTAGGAPTLREFSSELFQGAVDSFRARSHSQHHYYTRVITTRSYRVTQLPSPNSPISTVWSSGSQTSCSTSTGQLSAALSGLQRRVSSALLRVEEVVCHSVATIQHWYQPHAELGDIECPSEKNPVAPDGHIPNSLVRGVMNFRPPYMATTGVRSPTPSPASSPTSTYLPPTVRHIGSRAFKGSLDMYCWLLNKIINKLAVAGVRDTERLVSVVTELFQQEPERVEKAAQASQDDVEDFDLATFLSYLPNQGLLRDTLGEEIYSNLLFTLTKKYSMRTSATRRARAASDVSSLPLLSSPSSVDYSRLVDRSERKPLRPLPPSPLSSDHTPKTLSTTTSGLGSVKSALKLKWVASQGRRGGAPWWSTSGSPESPQTPEDGESSSVSLRGVLQGAGRETDSGRTGVSVPLRTDSSPTMHSEGSSGVVKSLHSSLRKSSQRSNRHQLSTVTFATPLVSSSELLPKEQQQEEEEERESGGEGAGHRKQRLGLDESHSDFYTVIKETGSIVKVLASAGKFVSDVMEPGAVLGEEEEMLRQVLLRSWFPEELRKGESRKDTVENVFKGVLKALGTDNIDVFGDACDTLLHLHGSQLLDREQKALLTVQLSARLRACSSIAEQAGLLPSSEDETAPKSSYSFFDDYSEGGVVDPDASDLLYERRYQKARAHHTPGSSSLFPPAQPFPRRPRRRSIDLGVPSCREESQVRVMSFHASKGSLVSVASAQRGSSRLSEGSVEEGLRMEGEEADEGLDVDAQRVDAERAVSHRECYGGAELGTATSRGVVASEPDVGDTTSNGSVVQLGAGLGAGPPEGRTSRTSARTGIVVLETKASFLPKSGSGGSFASIIHSDQQGSFTGKVGGERGGAESPHASSRVLSNEWREDRAGSGMVEGGVASTQRRRAGRKIGGSFSAVFSGARRRSEEEEGEEEGKEAVRRAMDEWMAKIISRSSIDSVSVATAESGRSMDKAREEVTLTLLNALERLGPTACETDVLQSILPMLVDKNEAVSQRAREVITTITGVKSRSGLQELLVQHGMMQRVVSNQDEILADLAKRVQEGKLPPLKYLFRPRGQKAAPTFQPAGEGSTPGPTIGPAPTYGPTLDPTPVGMAKALKRKLLKGYTFTTPPLHLHQPPQQGEASAVSLPLVTPPPSAGKSPGAEGEEVMYTFYTRDEDLQTKGRSLHSGSSHDKESVVTSGRLSARFSRTFLGSAPQYRLKMERMSQYGVATELPTGSGGGGHVTGHMTSHVASLPPPPLPPLGATVREYGWEVRSGDKRRRAHPLWRSLVDSPNSFSQTQCARNWMLEVYSHPRKKQCWRAFASCDRGGGARTGHEAIQGESVHSGTAVAGRGGQRNLPPLRTHELSKHRRPRGLLHYTREGEYLLDTSTRSAYQGLGKSHHHQVEMMVSSEEIFESREAEYEFEWSEVYPVLRTTSKFLVDKTKNGLQAKRFSLPPISERVLGPGGPLASLEEASGQRRQPLASLERALSRGRHSSSSKDSEERVLHIKLPKLPLQT